MQVLNTLRRWVQSTIGVSSKEANAFLVLLPALFLIIFSEPFYRWICTADQVLSVQETLFLDSLIADGVSRKPKRADSISLFPFDPNTATETELTSLGIPKFVAHRVEQYRVKGGKFRVKSDLARMYGLDSSIYVTLVPYINLPDKLIAESKPNFVERPKRVVEYNLNKADTADLKSVKGIGPVLASRIVKYRLSLGGFINHGQLKEVYGLDTIVIKELSAFYIEPEFVPEKLKINLATEEELDKHPYVSPRQAKAIITYRMQHGRFASINDLTNVKTLNDDFIRKIIPYISFE